MFPDCSRTTAPDSASEQHSPPTSTKPQVVAQTTDIYWPQAVTRISNGNPDHGHLHEVRLQCGLEQWIMGYQHGLQGQQGPQRSSEEVQSRKSNQNQSDRACAACFRAASCVSTTVLHTIPSVLLSKDMSPHPPQPPSYLHRCCCPVSSSISLHRALSNLFLHLSCLYTAHLFIMVALETALCHTIYFCPNSFI